MSLLTFIKKHSVPLITYGVLFTTLAYFCAPESKHLIEYNFLYFLSALLLFLLAGLYLRFRLIRVLELTNRRAKTNLDDLSKNVGTHISLIQKEMHKDRLQLLDRLTVVEQSVEKRLKAVEQSVEKRLKEVEKSVASYKTKNFQNILTKNQSFFQPFNRQLNDNILMTLMDEWANTKLDLTVTSKSLAYLGHRVCMLENLSKGRLATPIEDILLRILVSAAVKTNTLSVVEIGSLFGICLASIYEYTNSRFDKVHVTAIDPLDGYYSTNARDIITDERIDEESFIHNISLTVPQNSYTLIKQLSTNQKALSQVSKSKYDLLIIDGDHTYKGVKNDFDLYLPFANKGGYIIFDDYDVESWPDVKEFVDKEVFSNPAVELVGTQWRTAVFKVV